MRQYIRHAVREMKMKELAKSDLFAYSTSRKTRSASENINALITLTSLRSEDACGHGNVIADLADRITDGRIHRLTNLPEIDWQEIMNHMEDVARHAASLDFSTWRRSRKQSQTLEKEEVHKASSNPWWHNPTKIPKVVATDPFNKEITARAADEAITTGTSASASSFSNNSCAVETIGVALDGKKSRENCGASCEIS